MSVRSGPLPALAALLYLAQVASSACAVPPPGPGDPEGLWVAVDSPAEGALTNLSDIEVAGRAGGGTGPASVRVRADGGEWREARGNVSWSATFHLEDGRHLVEAEAADGGGNLSRSSVNITVDTRPPMVRLIYPADGELLNSSTVLVTGSTETGALVTISGAPAPVIQGTFGLEVRLVEGPNVIEAQGRDAAGNRNLTSIRVVVDTLPPELQVAEPANGSVTNRTRIPVRGTVENGSRVLLSGVALSTDGPYFLGEAELREGRNDLVVRAEDAAGNSNTVNLMIFSDLTPPGLEVLALDGTATTKPNITIAGLSRDAASVWVDFRPADLDAQGNFSADVLLLPGNNTITITARDPAGNQVTRTIRVLRQEEALPPPPPAAEPARGAGGEYILAAGVFILSAVLLILLLISVRGRAGGDG